MKYLAALFALTFAPSCVVQMPVRPMDERMIALATDAELCAEYRRIMNETPQGNDGRLFDILDALSNRWAVTPEAAHQIARGRVMVGVPERVVVMNWGEPNAKDLEGERERWTYGRDDLSGQAYGNKRVVVIEAGFVVEITPKQTYAY
jgi:hypothetical protein